MPIEQIVRFSVSTPIHPSTSRFVVASACAVLTLSYAVSSRAQESAASDWERPTLSCEPACRSGYECKRGECVPVCSPACPAGLLCSADGGCVRAKPSAATPAPMSSIPTAPNVCEPNCRNGYTCVAGRCVSMCNPACGADEMCTANGECVTAQSLDESADPPSDSKLPVERDASADSLVNLHLDVAGALQFGITPAVEVGESVSGYLRLRLMNAGLASYFLLGRDRDDELRLGLGAALGFHIFSASRGNMRGFYGGAALEYAFLRTRDTTRDFATYRTHALIPQVDFGYRWAFGDLLVGVAGTLALAIPFQNRATPVGGERGCRLETSCKEDLGVAFFPGITVDLGWFIPRSVD